MSTESITELLELASQHSSYWEGQGIGKAIEADIERHDYEALRAHLVESAKLMWDFERQNDDETAYDTLTDERAEAFYEHPDTY